MCVDSKLMRVVECDNLALTVEQTDCTGGAACATALLSRSVLNTGDSGTPWVSAGCSHCVRQRSAARPDTLARDSPMRCTRQQFASQLPSPVMYGNTPASELVATDSTNAMMRTLRIISA